MDTKTLVWFSRHDPTPEQTADLNARGITRIVKVNMQATDGKHIWEVCCDVVDAGMLPEVIMCIAPPQFYADLLRLANPANCHIIRAQMLYEVDADGKRTNAPPTWAGTWERIIRVEVVTEAW